MLNPDYPIVVIHHKNYRAHKSLSDLQLSYSTVNIQEVEPYQHTIIEDSNESQKLTKEQTRRHIEIWNRAINENIPFLLIFEDDVISLTTRERFDAVINENSNADLILLADDASAYGISNHGMKRILMHNPDPRDIKELLFKVLEKSSEFGIGVVKADPPLFKDPNGKIHIFWIILAISIIILIILWITMPAEDRTVRGILESLQDDAD